MSRKKIHYSETELHLYSVLWNLRHTPDLFSVKLERKTKSGKVFSVFSRFDVCSSYGEVDITHLVVKAGIRKTLTGLAYVGGFGFCHSRNLMSTFMYRVHNILFEHNRIAVTEIYDFPASINQFRAINFDKFDKW